MAIVTSYTTLQQAVTDYLGRADLASYAPNFTQNWEEKFYRDAKNWAKWMETSLSVAVSSGVMALPSAYLGMVTAYVDGVSGPSLERVSLEQLYQRFPRDEAAAVPRYYARNGSNLEFGPVASDGYVIKGTYYAKPTVMRSYASDAAAHWVIVNAPDLALYGSLLEAMPFLIDDPRVPMWKALYTDSLLAYREQHTEEKYSRPFMVAG